MSLSPTDIGRVLLLLLNCILGDAISEFVFLQAFAGCIKRDDCQALLKRTERQSVDARTDITAGETCLPRRQRRRPSPEDAAAGPSRASRRWWLLASPPRVSAHRPPWCDPGCPVCRVGRGAAAGCAGVRARRQRAGSQCERVPRAAVQAR